MTKGHWHCTIWGWWADDDKPASVISDTTHDGADAARDAGKAARAWVKAGRAERVRGSKLRERVRVVRCSGYAPKLSCHPLWRLA